MCVEKKSRVLPSLEEIGLAERVLGYPIKIRATPVEEALAAMIKRFRDETGRKVAALEAITVARAGLLLLLRTTAPI
jgi:sugar-specific transcriptional regulator TrmB